MSENFLLFTSVYSKKSSEDEKKIKSQGGSQRREDRTEQSSKVRRVVQGFPIVLQLKGTAGYPTGMLRAKTSVLPLSAI